MLKIEVMPASYGKGYDVIIDNPNVGIIIVGRNLPKAKALKYERDLLRILNGK